MRSVARNLDLTVDVEQVARRTRPRCSSSNTCPLGDRNAQPSDTPNVLDGKGGYRVHLRNRKGWRIGQPVHLDSWRLDSCVLSESLVHEACRWSVKNLTAGNGLARFEHGEQNVQIRSTEGHLGARIPKNTKLGDWLICLDAWKMGIVIRENVESSRKDSFSVVRQAFLYSDLIHDCRDCDARFDVLMDLGRSSCTRHTT